MALSREQWLSKIQTWVPTWFWEREQYNVAVFAALAATAASAQADAEGMVSETFLEEAAGAYLDLHGLERSVERVEDETDATYRPRIQNLISSTTKARIKEIVDKVLAEGECEVREGFQDLLFCDRDQYCDDDEPLIDQTFNFFLILVDRQAPDPLSFVDRSDYADRDTFASYDSGSSSVYERVVSAVNKTKALGVTYMIVERH